MPLQNRVTPLGEIIATSARGDIMGNRGGRIHYPDKTLQRRRWASKAWIACRLRFKGRHREVMSARSYTELFFLDEATALAAGHRPCFECRRETAVAFATHWAEARKERTGRSDVGAIGRARAGDMDRVLHEERLGLRTRSGSPGNSQGLGAEVGGLPDGVFVLLGGQPALVLDGRLLPWTPSGYLGGIAIEQQQRLALLTPPSVVAVISRGFCPKLHASAHQT